MGWRVPGAVVLAAGLLAACDGGGPTSAPTTVAARAAVEANAVVEHIVDGDTVDLLIGEREERVRLIGIDTPETERPDSPVECFGSEATDFVTGLLPVGTPVRVERDTVGRDDYGRLLGYVYRSEDGMFVNLEIVRQGFATPLSIAPNTTYASLFVEAARQAEAAGAGLWTACRQ